MGLILGIRTLCVSVLSQKTCTLTSPLLASFCSTNDSNSLLSASVICLSETSITHATPPCRMKQHGSGLQSTLKRGRNQGGQCSRSTCESRCCATPARAFLQQCEHDLKCRKGMFLRMSEYNGRGIVMKVEVQGVPISSHVSTPKSLFSQVYRPV